MLGGAKHRATVDHIFHKVV